jgi:hypothetical protein
VAKSQCQVTVEPGLIAHHYSEAESEAHSERWLAVFGSNRKGVNTNAYLWHMFSSGRYPSASGDEAWFQYTSQEATAFIVLCNDRKQAFLTKERPMSCSWSDCLIFPANLAWCMARTHEEGWLGPYFARHPRYADLDIENQAALRKQREAAVAKSRGWA